tara:strand:+ start:1274 stop:1693 length:420 start_codon:yes stop_codon:yes gene_type:complete
MKKSKIKTIVKKDKFKEMYKFELTMENGDVGIIYKVEDAPGVNENDEVHYTQKPNGSMKIVNPEYANQDSSSKLNYNYKNNEDERIARSVAIKTATDFGINKGFEVQQILELAKIMSDYILNDIQKKENVFDNSGDVPF